ncbi:hypothetical protein SEA_JUMBO_48 [Gordonia phage Jumbo]|uniref:Uncharacterized protein n=1 Tax=Gordonia phage Jumbo TaxID=1887650 RepID=A0A1B3B0U5_9CAUD|nr:hypothetical protein BIZ69_gp048 [Gordonia phage Jumbo]AOE44558.1 hypothetical protein SEA_JUMBO_48 [Gordonia phage Jumbo]
MVNRATPQANTKRVMNPVSFIGDEDKSREIKDSGLKDFTPRNGTTEDEAPKDSSVPESANESPDEPKQSPSPERNSELSESTGGVPSPLSPPISPPAE